MAISDCGMWIAEFLTCNLKFEIVGRSREWDFAKLNLHLGIFEQPQENDFFSKLLIY